MGGDVPQTQRIRTEAPRTMIVLNNSHGVTVQRRETLLCVEGKAMCDAKAE